jgi:hypothetical protein
VIPSAEVAHLVGETVTEAEVEARAVTVSEVAIALA